VFIVKREFTQRITSIYIEAPAFDQRFANPLPGTTPDFRMTPVERANPNREGDVVRPFALLQLEIFNRHLAKAQTARSHLDP
jgi:hypothetical protein